MSIYLKSFIKLPLILTLAVLSNFVFAVPTGEISHPIGVQTGNIIILAEVSDPDGLDSVGIEFSNGRVINICSGNCGTSQRFFRSGVSPTEFGLSPGSIAMNLWVGDTSNVIDSNSFTWSPTVITGVQSNRVPGSITFNWNAAPNILRYNLYVASEANITPGNAEGLPNGRAFRSINGTSQVVEGIPDDLGIFALVTGVDSSGESAFSAIVRVEAFDNMDPIVESESFTLEEDSSITGNVLSNDSDPEGQPLTSEIVDGALNGEVTLDEEGNFSYTPAPNFNGSDSFRYTANDLIGGSQIGTVTLTVTPVNDAPTANEDNYETPEDIPLIVSSSDGLLNNDIDIDGDPLTILEAGTIPGTFGIITMAADGGFSYAPNENAFGQDSFSYSISDLSGVTSSSTLTINVQSVNDAPITEEDIVRTEEGTSVSGNVLVNDSDIEGDTLTAQVQQQPSNGELSLLENGDFNYTPTAGFAGNDSFTYNAIDGNGGITLGSVSIEVVGQNDAPVAVDDAFELNEDNVLNVSAPEGLLANDSDPENDALTVTLLTNVSSGTLNLNSDGSFEYTPAINFNGTDSFVYQASDGIATATANVTLNIIPINDAPEAINDSANVDEGSEIQISVLDNDSDADNDTLRIVSTSAEIGVLSFNDTLITYLAPIGGGLTDTITYTISDRESGGLTSTASVAITINDINLSPVAQDDSVETQEDQSVTINVLANDTDPDGDALSVTIDSVTNGSAEVSTDGTIQFVPETNFNGQATINYTASDPSGASGSAIVTVTVTPVNDTPVANDDVFEGIEDEVLSVSDPAAGLLANDSDPDLSDEDKFTGLIVSLLQPPESGELNLQNNGTFTYQPELNFFGTINFSYQISDAAGATDSATVTINIADVMDEPVTEPDSYETDEDTALEVDANNGVLANDSIPDGSSLTAALLTEPSLGTLALSSDGSFSYTPTENANGSDSFTYEAISETNEKTTGEVTININPVNDAPVAVEDTAEVDEGAEILIDVLANDSDVDNDTLTIDTASAELGTVSVDANNLLSYTAPVGQTTDTVSYTISDPDGLTASATIAIKINDVNTAPIAVDDSVTINEDQVTSIDVLSNDSDPDGDALTISEATASSGNAIVTGSAISYTPELDSNAPATIIYTVQDPSGLSASAEVNISISPVNDIPVANNDSVSTSEDVQLTILPTDNDIDVDNDDLTINFFDSSVTGGTVSQLGTNALLFSPTLNFFGTTQINYTISDGNGGTASAIITVVVSELNNVPIANTDSASVFAAESVDITPLSNDTDADNEALTISSATADIGTVAISGDFTTITYSAPADTTATATISYTISDTRGATSNSTISVAITEQTFSGDFDPDNDGTTDVTATQSGDDYVITFGNDVDSVFYEENGETVSVSTNDDGIFELTVLGNTAVKPGKKDGIIIRELPNKNGDTSGKWSQNRFEIGGSNSVQIFYTVNGQEYDFTVSNLDQTAANVAFGKPRPLNTDFSGQSSFEFYTKTPSFKGPLRTGVNTGERYGLFSDNTGFFSGTNSTGALSWSIVNGDIDITFTGGTEQEVDFLNVYDLDDDNSDGIALGVITKAEADAYTAANFGNVFVSGFIKNERHIIRLIRDAKVFIEADIEEYYSYRIDSSVHPQITSANSFVAGAQPAAIHKKELFDLQSLKIRELTGALISGEIVLQIPIIDSITSEFESFEYDLCTFTESSAGSNAGSGSCTIYGISFSWSIINRVLDVTFSNSIDTEYRWLDEIEGANTFVADAEYNFMSQMNTFSSIGFWVKNQMPTDAEITSFISGNYLDSSFTTTNPNNYDANRQLLQDTIFGFYFDASGNGKRILGEIDGQNVIYFRDENRKWAVNSGDLKITALSSRSSGNTFTYSYDLCTDTANANCFVWRLRDWEPLAIVNDRMWVLEFSQINSTFSTWGGSLNYDDFFDPRINFYDINTVVPGAPNSQSFNFEPIITASTGFVTSTNVSLTNIDIISSALDPEADTLTVTQVVAENGTTTINAGTTFDYVPDTNFNGVDNLDIIVTDGINEVRVFAQVTVGSVGPTASDDFFFVTASVSTQLFPLTNDFDPNSDPLIITSAVPVNGSLTIDSGDQSLTYSTTSATDEITYTVSDGNGNFDTAVIYISTSAPANNPPVANNDSGSSVASGNTITLSPLSNDTDADSDPLTITGVSTISGTAIITGSGTTIDFTPSIGSGTATINYDISDGNGGTDSAVISVNVTTANSPPVANDDSINLSQTAETIINVLLNDSDPDSDLLTITNATATGGTVTILSGNTALKYVAPASAGAETITYDISDGNGGSDSANVNVTIGALVGSLPIASNDSVTVPAGTNTILTPLDNDTDADSDPLTITEFGLSGLGFVNLNADNETFAYSAPNTSGTDIVSYTVSDGTGGTDTAEITVTITASNTAPFTSTDSYNLLDNATNSTVSIGPQEGLLINDSDSDGNSLEVVSNTGPSYGTLTVHPDGGFDYQHDGSDNLSDSFSYTISDGNQTDTGSVFLSINKENNAPYICNIPRTHIQLNQAYSGFIEVKDDDGGDTPAFTVTGEPTWMTVTPNSPSSSEISFSGTPTADPGDIGTSTITVTATDGVDSDSITFDVTVYDDFGTSSNIEIDFAGAVETVHDAVLDKNGRIVLTGSVDDDIFVARVKLDGQLDTTFNATGTKIIDINAGANDIGYAIDVYRDNRIVVVGTSDSGGVNADTVTIVLLEDGSFDTGYDTDGILVSDVNSGDRDGAVDVIAEDNGYLTVLVEGEINATSLPSTAVLKLNVSGGTVSSFDSDGQLFITNTDELRPNSFLEDGFGNIYIVGMAEASADKDGFIARINPAGMDTGFATSGIYLFDESSQNEYFNDLAFDANGDIIAVGVHNTADLGIWRFNLTAANNATISPDSTFNSSTGILVDNFGGSETDAKIISDKRGNYYVSARTGTDTNIIRMSPNGNKDAAFDGDGTLTIPFTAGVSGRPNDIMLDANGQLLALDTDDVGTNEVIQLAHYYILDPPTFGICEVTSDFVDQTNGVTKTSDTLTAAAIASDDNVFAVGYSNALDDLQNDFVVVKGNGDGSLDPSWGKNGYQRIDSGSVSISITPDEAVVTGADELVLIGTDSASSLFVAKLDSLGELDTSFDTDGILDVGAPNNFTIADAAPVSSSLFQVLGFDTDDNGTYIYQYNTFGTSGSTLEDNTFGAGISLNSADGAVNYTRYQDANFFATNIVTLSNTSIFVVGSLLTGNHDVAILKMDSSGLIDLGFGTSGAESGLYSLSETEDIVVLDSTESSDGSSFFVLAKNASNSEPRIYKFDSTGALATSFGKNGVIEVTGQNAAGGGQISSDTSSRVWIYFTDGTSQDYISRIDDVSGELDTSFINAGTAQLYHGVNNWTGTETIFILNSSDEASLLGSVSDDFVFASMNSSGFISNEDHDNTFDFGEGESASAIALDEYSRVILGGSSYSTSNQFDDFALVRFDNSGNIDNTFGSFGITGNSIQRFNPNSEEAQLSDITIVNSGSIYATGQSFLTALPSDNDVFSFRTDNLLPAAIDADYGSANREFNTAGADDLVGGHYLADDGSRIVVGSTRVGAGFSSGTVQKYDNGGAIDSTFNSASGVINLSGGSGDVHLNAVVRDANTGYVAVGWEFNGTDYDGLIVRFSESGILDAGFDTDGIQVFTATGTNEMFTDVAIASDGTVVVTGLNDNNALIVTYDKALNGTLNTAFNGALGYLEVDFGASPAAKQESFTAIEVDAFDAIVLVAQYGNDFGLYRYKLDSAATLISNYGGFKHFGPVNKMRDMAIDSLGNVFITGSVQESGKRKFFVIRYPVAVGPL